MLEKSISQIFFKWASKLRVLFKFSSSTHVCKFFFLSITFKKNIYLFLAALGLRCCTQAFSSCGQWGLLFIAVHRLLIAVASLVADHRLQACSLQQLWHAGSVVVARRLQSTGSVVVAHGPRCSVACGVWDFPGPGLEPVSPALAGGFLTTVPPGKSCKLLMYLSKAH